MEGNNCKIARVYSYYKTDTLINKVYYYRWDSGRLVIAKTEVLTPIVLIDEVSENFKKIIARDQYQTLRNYNLNL